MKTQEELNVLKQEFESLSKKLQGLSDDELKTVVGSGALEDYLERMKHYADALNNPEYKYHGGI